MTTTPAETIIEKFGGLTKTATALGSAVSTVQGWKERGRIPQDRWDAIMKAATVAGFELNLADFVAMPVAQSEHAN